MTSERFNQNKLNINYQMYMNTLQLPTQASQFIKTKFQHEASKDPQVIMDSIFAQLQPQQELVNKPTIDSVTQQQVSASSMSPINFSLNSLIIVIGLLVVALMLIRKYQQLRRLKTVEYNIDQYQKALFSTEYSEKESTVDVSTSL